MGATVGYATLQIIPSAKGFGAALNGQVDPIVTQSSRRHGEKAGKSFTSGFMPGIKGIGGALAAAYAGSKAIGFLKDSVAEASDLNEAGTKLQQVFGKATGDVLKFAGAGAKGLGQSNLAVQNAAALFGVYGRAAGLAGKSNADFSTQLVQLSTDLASFYNTDPAEAAQALASGLRGETEPLRAYGVLLDANSIKAEALRQGLIKSTKDALTPQAKVLATQALILKQTSVAQGDFARTSGGLANQQRILAAQTANLKGKIGAALLPAAVAATKGLNGLFSMGGKVGPVFDRVSKSFSKNVLGGQHLGDAFSALFAAMKDGDVTSNGVVGAFERIGVQVRNFALFIKRDVVPGVKSFVSGLAKELVPVVKSMVTFWATELIPTVISFYKGLVTALMPTLHTLGEIIKNRLVPLVALIAKKFREWWPTIKQVATILARIGAVILKYVLPVVLRLAAWIADKLIRVLVRMIGWVVKVIGWVIKFGEWIGIAAYKVTQFVGWVKQKFGDLVGFVKGLPGKIAAAAKGMWNGIKDSFRAAVNFIIDKWNGLSFHIGGQKVFGKQLPSVTLDTPNIPRLATGGIVRHRPGGILANIGEGREDEAVIPLSKLPKPEAPERRSGDKRDAPLVGSLTLQSTGNAHDDMEEVLFHLRRIGRGGPHA